MDHWLNKNRLRIVRFFALLAILLSIYFCWLEFLSNSFAIINLGKGRTALIYPRVDNVPDWGIDHSLSFNIREDLRVVNDGCMLLPEGTEYLTGIHLVTL